MVRSLWSRALASLAACLALSAGACSGGDEGAFFASDPGWKPGEVPQVESCELGAERECGVTRDARAGIITCFHGTQRCEDGVWGKCENGTLRKISRPAAAPAPPIGTLAALSTPSDCVANPCDPGCQVFEEDPPDPIETEPTDPIYDWETGSIAGYPNGLVKKGLVEPCETGSDCQFNTYCSAPSAGSCEHAVCEAGIALEDGCTACTTAVCAQDPTCCEEVTEVDTCDHDPCARGSRLRTGCNSCVTQICAARPSCCSSSGTWDSTCVAMVASTCGNTCECARGTASNGRCYEYSATTRRYSQARSACQGLSTSNEWDLVSITDATENTVVRTWGNATNVLIGLTEVSSNNWKWSNGLPSGTWNQTSRSGMYANWTATTEPGTDSCAMMRAGTSGKWEGANCNTSYAYVCEGPPERMVKAAAPPHVWDAGCVSLVASVCDAICDPSDAGNTDATCTPWYPGETQATCTGIDLAIGVPCEGVVPVCNHGQTAAPSGVRLVHFPANSMQYPATSPDLTHPQMKQCFTSEPIPPGECISVTTCPGLTGNREFMVNPTGAVSECSRLDNWSLYSKGAECGAPICAGGSSSATIVKTPVDIIVSIDNSASMQGEIQSVQSRINDDLAAILESSSIDYRVILVTRYGNVYSSNYDSGTATDSQYSVCIGSPLSSLDCPVSSVDSTPAVANTPPNFYHHSTDIGSNNMWCRLLESYTRPDPYPVARTNWTSAAPDGWGAFLREEAFKVFIGITDDNPLATNTTYTHGSATLARDCPNMLGDASLDGTNDNAGANDFDTALRTLAPTQFGPVSGTRNYIWHSIVGMTAPDATPLLPAAAVETRCCRRDRGVDNTCQGTTGLRVDDAANAGQGYQYLSKLTGGLRYPSCYHDNFDAIFNAVAAEVIEQASASCDLTLSDMTSFDPAVTTVFYTTVNSSGTDVSTELTRVANAAACTANAWYYDGSSGTSLIKLCPTTCTAVQADENARVTAELGCESEPAITTHVFTYTGVCAADEGVVWLDLGYDATIPGDGSIAFRVRAAADEPSLGSAPSVALGSATSASQSCGLGTACALDVFAALGAADATLPALELEITLTPSTSGGVVSLDEWQLTYSCRDNQ